MGNGHELRRLVSDVALKGSYNYSETVVTGLANHEKRDVRPHEKYHDVRDIYVNPPSPFVPLFIRVFPKTAPNESEPLAKQL